MPNPFDRGGKKDKLDQLPPLRRRNAYARGLDPEDLL